MQVLQKVLQEFSVSVIVHIEGRTLKAPFFLQLPPL